LQEAKLQPKIYFDICHGTAVKKYTKEELLKFANSIGIDTMTFVKQIGKDTLVDNNSICKIVKDVLDANTNSTGLLQMSKPKRKE